MSYPKVLRYFVYYNLTKKVWSVRSVASGLVVEHTKQIVLFDAIFKVSEAGRQRVLRDKRKNVHAGVQGKIGSYQTCLDYVKHNDEIVSKVRYNPYVNETFVDNDGNPIFHADVVVMTAEGKPEVIAYTARNER